MILVSWFLYATFYSISLLPMWVLHRFSDIFYFFIYRVWGYRRKVVRENLLKSFPEKSVSEINEIEKKYYVNLCDLIFETIKTFSISKKEMRSRCILKTPAVIEELYQKRANLTGISSHLANWEWLALALALDFKHDSYGVYKPLSNQSLNRLVAGSRERFGIRMIAMSQVKEVLKAVHSEPVMMGLLSDQAPHHYAKAFEVKFLNQQTFVVPGPGLITVQQGYTPIWGWMRRTGRSRFEWGIEVLTLDDQMKDGDQAQVERISKVHHLSTTQAVVALNLTRLFSEKLEQKIKMAPQDWLWSHRRWKLRDENLKNRR